MDPSPRRVVATAVPALIRAVMIAIGFVVLMPFFPWSHPLTLVLGSYLLAAVVLSAGLFLMPGSRLLEWINLLVDAPAMGCIAYLLGPATSPAGMLLVIPVVFISVRVGPRVALPSLLMGLSIYLAALVCVTAGLLPPVNILSPLPPRAPSILEALNTGLITVLVVGGIYPSITVILRERDRFHQREVAAVKHTEELARQLDQARALESLGRLAGGVAHDFNNLLAVVLGNVQLLRREGDEAVLVEEIEGAALRAQGLTEQLLAYGLKQPLRGSTTALAPVLLELVARLRPEIAPCTLELSLPGEPRGEVSMDREPLEEVLVALVHNAVEAMGGEGAVTLTLSVGHPAPEETTGPPGRRFAVLTVGDQGPGMDADTRARAFDPYFSTKELGHGSGLGLSMVHGSVHHAGGTALIDSEPGAGTRVHLHLPLVETDAAPDEISLDESRPITVLVVDDEELVRRMTSRALRQEGYEVVQAEGGYEALEAISDGGLPDLVLTDVRMPELSGPELAQRLGDFYPSLPVAFMSGFVDEFAPEGPLSSEEVLAKPFSVERLRQHVRAALKGGAKDLESTS